MDPNQQLPTQPDNAPMFKAPFNQPFNAPTPTVSSSVPTPTMPIVSSIQPIALELEQPGPRRSKLSIILYVAAGLELFVIIGLAIALAAAPKNTSGTAANGNSKNGQSQAPQPATAVGVQQTSDSISQDLGNLNDGQDLPPNKLNDQSLGL